MKNPLKVQLMPYYNEIAKKEERRQNKKKFAGMPSKVSSTNFLLFRHWSYSLKCPCGTLSYNLLVSTLEQEALVTTNQFQNSIVISWW